jgi:cell division inhibitor SepF
MGAMYRLKAYFGMVPADEMGEYADEPVPARFSASRRGDRWDERYDDEQDVPADRYDDDWDRRPARATVPERPREAPVRTGPPAPMGLGPAAVRGALAVDPDTVVREPTRIPTPAPSAVPEQRERAAGGAGALSRITTLQPRSYNEARTIGERYRDGVPVIMNLTELDDAAAKRLVDFAAGLAFALRGSIDKVTSRVFLLTPADVEVSADDARRLAARTVGEARVDTGRAVGEVRVDTARGGGGVRAAAGERGLFRQD